MADDIMKQAMSTIFDGDPFFDEEPSQTFDEVPNQTLFQPVFITQSRQPGNVNYQMRMNTVQNSGANLTPQQMGSQQVLLPLSQMRPVQIGLASTPIRPSLGANVANSSMLQQLRIQQSGGQTVMISNPTSTINPLTSTGTLHVVRRQPHSGGKTTVLLRSVPGNLVANSPQAMPTRIIPRQPVQPMLVRFQPTSTTPLPIKRVQSFSGTTGIQIRPDGSQLAQSPIVQLVTRPAGQQLVTRPDATKPPLMVVVPQSLAAVGSTQPKLIKVATVPNMATSMQLRLPGQPRVAGQQLQVIQGQPRVPGQTVQIMQGQPRQLLPRMQEQLLQTVPGQSLPRVSGQPVQFVQRPSLPRVSGQAGQPLQIVHEQSSLPRVPGQQIQIVQGQPLQRLQGQPLQRLQGQPLQGQPLQRLQGQQKIVVQTANVSNSTHTPVIICRSNSPAGLNSIARNPTPATLPAVPSSASSSEPADVSKYSSTVQTSSLDRLSISNIPAQTTQPESCDSRVASFIPEHPIPSISGKSTDNSSTVSHNVVTVSSSGPLDFSIEDLLNTDNYVPTGVCDELDALFGIAADVKNDVKIEGMDTKSIEAENFKSESVKMEDVTVAEDVKKVEIKSEDVKAEPSDSKEIKVEIKNSEVKVEKEADVPVAKFNIGDDDDDDDDDTFDFFKAIRELQETNKKAELYEATLLAKEEENKRKDEEFTSSNLSTLLPNITSQSTSSSSSNLFSSSSLYHNTSQGPLFSSNSIDSGLADAYNSSSTAGMNLNSWDVPEIPLSISGQPYARTFNNRMSQLQSSASNRFLSGGHVISGMPVFGPRLLHSASVSGGLKTILVGKTTGQVVPSPTGMKMEQDVTRAHWSTDTIETRMLNMRDEEDAELEELGHAETYADYMPQKLKIGCKHPDPVVESSSLSSVDSPDVTYQLKIANECIEKSLLSALQLESVTYVCQKHETYLPNRDRTGYLIGDGAGVGKGRTIAGIIHENLMHGRKRSLWLSVSNDLMEDAIRDLRDIGCDLPVFPLNKFKYGKLSSSHNNKVKEGVIFATYSSLISEMRADKSMPKYMKKYNSRLKQLVNWLGRKFDGLIIFDECHRAKNLYPVGSTKPTKTGQTVVKLQRKLPNARVVYASATGASEPRNMAYMTRLGLWGPNTPFKDFNEFILAVEKRGVGAMELAAMEMKQRGSYIARQLSFKGVSFNIEEVGITKEFKQIYNRSVELWVEALIKFNEAIELLQLDKQARKNIYAQFWSSHQRFFKYLCISAKVQHCIARTLNAVKNGKCVVIGLQSTGEARIKEMIEEMEGKGEELQDFISSTKGVIQKLIETYFPTPNNNKIISDMFASDSPTPSLVKGRFNKRAGANTKWNAKRQKVEESVTISDDEEDDEMDSASEKSEEAISVSDGSDFDDDDDESDHCSSGSESDDNPFANGNDLPWLKQKKESQTKKGKKKEEEEENKKEKEKKKGKEKEKKEKEKSAKRRKLDEEDDDDDDDDFDNFDEDESVAKILAAVRQREEAAAMSSAFTSKKSELTETQRAEKVFQMKQSLLAAVEELGKDLPPNTLDELIDAFGGPSCVAEMTGRKSRIISTKDGGVSFEKRSESDISLEKINLAEKKRFMDGEKLIAIISEAASSGISLQADRRAINQRRRVHITLELPWSADRAVQQFGRTHRSNQVSAPEYIFLISNLAGERRFAATVAKRLESLGALTHGDRRATETRDLSQFNIDNKYGISALDALMKAVVGDGPMLVPPPSNYKRDFFADARKALVGVGMMSFNETYGYTLEKDSNCMNKFLNRILGIDVDLQNALFQYFQDTHKYVILKAKREKHWDLGILDLGSSGEKVHEADHRDFHGTFAGIRTKVVLSKVLVERGMTFEAAEDILLSSHGSDDGFYESQATYAEGRKLYIMAIAVKNKNKTKDKEKEVFYKIYRANAGLQACHWGQAELLKKFRRVADSGDIKPYWDEHYAQSENSCMHVYQFKNCVRGANCELGRRAKIYIILSGSVLSVWTSVERVLASLPGGHATRMQIIRLRTDDGRRIVGTLIPVAAIEPLKQLLSNPNGAPTTSSLGASQSHLGGERSSPAPLVRPMQWAQQLTNSSPAGMFRQGGKDQILGMPSLL